METIGNIPEGRFELALVPVTRGDRKDLAQAKPSS